MADLSYLTALGKPLAILGLGVSGRAVAEACLASGIAFHAWDDNEERRAECAHYPIRDMTGDLGGYAYLVPAAGIKPTHPVVQRFVQQKVPVMSDVDLLLESAPEATVIGVTGTNGKSTTTALIGHILKEAGRNVAVGGNIGVAACSLPSLDATGIYVLEMSSYMLAISARPVADIAVLLNLTPDHLDWHGTIEDYTEAKEKIFRQRQGRMPQIRLYGFSIEQPLEALPVMPEHPFLKGSHNAENIFAAIQACRACGLSDDVIMRHLNSFEGLPHRQKRVAQYKHVTFVNDSKATNANATGKALASFDNIYWIVGGMPKSDGLEGLEAYYPKIRKAYTIGQAEKDFAKFLKGQVPVTKSGTIQAAVIRAFEDAMLSEEEAVILLSPACASFDQYRNFEERGDDFVAQVRHLLEVLNPGEMKK